VSPLRAVISDFGGVLSSPLAPAFAAVQAASGIPSAALGAAMARLEERDGRHPLYELECGRMTEHDFLDGVGREVAAEVGHPVEMHEFSARWFAALGTNHAMVDYLRGVGERGYRMAILTNNVREWEPRWRAMLPVDEIFELVVDSAFVGMRKPDPAIYALTCERLGIAPGDCLFIDDFEHNCAAASALGITAVHFLTTEQAIEEIEAALN